MKRYYTYTVKKIVTVQHLITIEYLQIGPNFSYPAEKHDFYEFVYVEKGKIVCNTDSGSYVLGNHDLFLISPEELHSYEVKTSSPSNILIVCFKSKSNMISLVNSVQHLSDELHQLVIKLLDEAKQTFVFPFDEKLTLNDAPRLGSQQLIENYIEELLIKLIQMAMYQQKNVHVLPDTLDIRATVVAEIKEHLQKNIYSKITLGQICKEMLYSKTYLNDTFREVTGSTIMQYYQELKIEEAKRLLIKNKSIAEIAEQLCYESPQYFARAFKKRTGYTPSEFKKHMLSRK